MKNTPPFDLKARKLKLHYQQEISDVSVWKRTEWVFIYESDEVTEYNQGLKDRVIELGVVMVIPEYWIGNW